MKHLTETQLNEYLDGFLEPTEKTLIQAHLFECEACQEKLAALQTVFQALAALPELTPERDLSASVLKTLPRDHFALGWRLAFAMQAGLSLGFLLLLSPLVNERVAGMMAGWPLRLAVPEMKFPNPVYFHFSLPAIPLPHLPNLALPVMITAANYSTWLVLGIAALLLFVVGNFSLIFRKSSRAGK